jgi:hypothetical protein
MVEEHGDYGDVNVVTTRPWPRYRTPNTDMGATG